MAREKVVLAYSGGLDTSCCIQWLMKEKDLDVITLLVNVGQECDDLEFSRQKALDCGAVESIVLDVQDEFADEYCGKAIAANGLYQALDPDLKVIAPVRVWDLYTRPQEIAFAEANGIPVGAKKASPYSIDDNLWGRAIECGVLEDPWNEPPADIWKTTKDIADTPDTPTDVVVGFKAGMPCSLDGVEMSARQVIEKLDVVAGDNGYGRLDQLENRLVGIKSRECYEVPGGCALICAHKALEDLCLERELLHYKLGAEQKWAELVYYGLWFSPLKLALDAFFASTQQCVTGEVKLRFHKGTCTVVGRRSAHSLYDYGLATYDEGDTFDRDSAAGFIFQWGLPSKVWAKHRKDAGVEGQI